MMEVRCGQCHKLLARADGNVEIKCPRCGCINHWRASAADHSSPSPDPRTPRASSTRENNDDACKKPIGLAGWKKPPGRPDHPKDAGPPDLLRGVRGSGLGAL
ncbi:Com family DNA-binding transcriptional regulator [Paracidovorax valerianellae]|uniref:Com family DNA-binding transcriptional regulator n=1 Tax=Paracidovorax valerianellae TaxID=187868 RepID=UPI001C3162EF